ncbi:MAG: PilN domain-containing protein [Rubrivivax sp.]
MILINLLPHREERRRRQQAAFYTGIGLSMAVGVLIAMVWYAALGHMASAQRGRITFLSTEVGILERQIRDIATLNADIDALKARQKAVEDLQIERNTPVRLLGELARQTPEGVYLLAIRQTGDRVFLSGHAQSNERVSEFLRNVSYQSAWLQQPELLEIRVVPAAPGSRQDNRVAEFSMRLTIKRSPIAEPAAAPPAAGPRGP